MVSAHAKSKIKGTAMFVRPEISASFFSQIIQGGLSERIAKTFRTTYMVALRKRKSDPIKLLFRYDTDFGGSKPFGHSMKIHNSVIWLNWVMFNNKIIIYVKL